jgi:hypothetical protein
MPRECCTMYGFTSTNSRKDRHVKNLSLKLALLVASLFFAAAANADPEWMDHASWCLKPAGATRTLMQQPSQDGNCGALQAGVLLATYFSGNDGALDIASTHNQYDMGTSAAAFACSPATEQIAIRLLQVCQCHNIAATKSIENNQTEVIDWLKSWQRGQNRPC